MTTSMSKLTTSLIREPALQIGETIREPASQMTTSIKNVEKQQQQQQHQQQQLAKEVFSPRITKFRRESNTII